MQPDTPAEANSGDQRATSEVVASLIANLQALLKTQFELLKLEVTGVARDKGIAVGLFIGAALFGFFVLAFVGVTGAHALALVLPLWAAWLIITGVYLLIAAVGLRGCVWLHLLAPAPRTAPRRVRTVRHLRAARSKPLHTRVGGRSRQPLSSAR